MICLFCKNNMMAHHNGDSVHTTLFVCYKCITNNHMFSCVDNHFKNSYPNNHDNYINQYKTIKLNKIQHNINSKQPALAYFNINNIDYIATEIYSLFEANPTRLIIDSISSYDEKDIGINFINIIKNCKNPQEAVDHINTLALFS